MSEIAIQADGIGKRYRLGQIEPYKTLRDSISRAGRRLFHRDEAVTNGGDSELWALKDVSFEIKRGDVVGIIGRNGAGKSTLLKILSRITEPTEGRAELSGRVGSLLEVGTGFHPELSGRENVHLNGAILGMTRAEIARRFDEIVSFAEIERFLETPVKRYSSGMYTRLAFAVAAHLESEILIVDEVLAVGDVEFQRKCLGKMSGVAKSGRTVLFVSHNMAAVEGLCTRCLWLDAGRVRAAGATCDVIEQYVASGENQTAVEHDLATHAGRRGSGRALLRRASLNCGDERGVSSIRMGSSLDVEVLFESPERPLRPVLGVSLKNSHGAPLFTVNNRVIPGFRAEDPLTRGTTTCHLPLLPLMPGRYAIDLFLGDEHQDLDIVRDAATFEVTAADVFGSGRLPSASAGPFFLPARWSFRGEIDAREPILSSNH